jgi:hypothetical protein
MTTSKTWKRIPLVLALTLVGALGIGGWLAVRAYAQGPWGGYGGYGMMGQGMMNGWGGDGGGYGTMGQGMMDGWGGDGGDYGMMGPGMMGGWGYGSPQDCGMMGLWGGTYPEGTETLTMNEAKAAVESSLKAWNNDDLEVAEMMEFSRQFYAIVQEKSTGIGAFEVLVDKVTGTVYPEPGPNMMWNRKYGMMGSTGMGMMGGSYGGMMGSATGPARSATMSIGEAEAVELAQEYLDRVRPGHRADEETDAFYGYYTLHVLTDGQAAGMLSVNGYTGQVWYHTWHGAFVDMSEHE